MNNEKKRLRILSLDLSFSKTGIAVTDVYDDDIFDLIYAGMVNSDKGLDPIPRIIKQLEDIEEYYKQYSPDIVIKEESVIGRSSTSTNVIKTHALIEHTYFKQQREIKDLHNATIKKWARNTAGVQKGQEYDKKKVVAKAVELWYNRHIEEIWGVKGGLKDDMADAIAIPIVWKLKTGGKL